MIRGKSQKSRGAKDNELGLEVVTTFIREVTKEGRRLEWRSVRVTRMNGKHR